MNWSNTKHGEAQADELINWGKKMGPPLQWSTGLTCSGRDMARETDGTAARIFQPCGPDACSDPVGCWIASAVGVQEAGASILSRALPSS